MKSNSNPVINIWQEINNELHIEQGQNMPRSTCNYHESSYDGKSLATVKWFTDTSQSLYIVGDLYMAWHCRQCLFWVASSTCSHLWLPALTTFLNGDNHSYVRLCLYLFLFSILQQVMVFTVYSEKVDNAGVSLGYLSDWNFCLTVYSEKVFSPACVDTLVNL